MALSGYCVGCALAARRLFLEATLPFVSISFSLSLSHTHTRAVNTHSIVTHPTGCSLWDVMEVKRENKVETKGEKRDKVSRLF